MRVIITKQNADGSFDEVGMNNRRLFSHYKTVKGAIKYAAVGWKGRIRFEFFGSNIYGDPYRTLFVER